MQEISNIYSYMFALNLWEVLSSTWFNVQLITHFYKQLSCQGFSPVKSQKPKQLGLATLALKLRKQPKIPEKGIPGIFGIGIKKHLRGVC